MKREVKIAGFGFNRFIHRGCLTLDILGFDEDDQIRKRYNLDYPKDEYTKVDIKKFVIELYPKRKFQPLFIHDS